MKKLKGCALELLEQIGIGAAEISITFVNDDIIRGLNKEYRGIDDHTDVIAFDLSDPLGDLLLGDVYISMERIVKQAKDFGVGRKEEALRLLVHGLLHLCGYRDDTDVRRKVMFEMQENLVKEFLSGGL
jgi:rRNA maturation RNase YbeY